MTLLLTITILISIVSNIAVLQMLSCLLDAVQFLLEQIDVIDVLLELRGEKDDD